MKTTRDLPWATAMFLAAMGLYWLTLAPGLLGLVDTPKFQFVGSILGVPHPPGYPLYVLLSYGFSHVPFGSLAYRINLMSAVFGAMTVALVFLCGRKAECGRLVSAVGAFGFGCGQLFWSTAVIAEVYTLHTTLLAAILLALLSWGQTRSTGSYYMAVACIALSFGHHTTMVLLVPAFAAYVLLVDEGYALQPRRVVATLGVLTLGLAPYVFIAIRTLQEASYIETPIASFSDGAAAVLSRRWQPALFAFDVPTLLRQRIPLISTMLLRQFSLPGVLVAVGGVAYLIRIRAHRPLAVLFGLAGLINVIFVLNYDIGEIAVFLLPTVLTGWLCATVLLGQGQLRARRLGRSTSALLTAGLIGWTAWHVQRGYSESDRSNEFQEIRRFDALFDSLPARSVIVSNDYLINSMVRYKLLGEGAAGQRTIHGPVRPDLARLQQFHDEGFAIFAFSASAVRLRLQGARLVEVSLFEPVERHLGFLPDNTIVAIAAPSGAARLLTGDNVDRIGGLGPLPPDSTMGGGIIGVASVRGAPLEEWQPNGAQLDVGEGDEIGTTGITSPTRIAVRANSRVASVQWGNDRDREEAEGAVLVELNPDGTLQESHVVNVDTRYGVELDQSRKGYGMGHIPDLQLYRLLEPGRCEDVPAGGWVDIGALAREGKIAVTLSGGSSLTIYAGRATPLAPRVTYVTAGSTLDLATQRIMSTPESPEDLRRELERAGVLDVSTADTPPLVYRLTLNNSSSPATATGTTLVFGGIPEFAVARQSVGEAGSARICSATLGYDGLFGDSTRRVERLDWQRNGHDELLGHGWYGKHPQRVRWTTDAAELLLPLWRSSSLQLSVTASRPGRIPDDQLGTVQLEVNGHMLDEHQLRRGWAGYTWDVSATVVRKGLNQVYLRVSPVHAEPDGSGRMVGIRVREVRLTLVP